MSAGVSAALVGVTSKQKAEASNFQAFRVALPNFAGPLASIEWGADPPDVLCVGASGSRIGVELVQWINQRQIADSKKRYKLEDSYTLVIQSESVGAPPSIGMILFTPKFHSLRVMQQFSARSYMRLLRRSKPSTRNGTTPRVTCSQIFRRTLAWQPI
jgi:hypothetical protein